MLPSHPHQTLTHNFPPLPLCWLQVKGDFWLVPVKGWPGILPTLPRFWGLFLYSNPSAPVGILPVENLAGFLALLQVSFLPPNLSFEISEEPTVDPGSGQEKSNCPKLYYMFGCDNLK